MYMHVYYDGRDGGDVCVCVFRESRNPSACPLPADLLQRDTPLRIETVGVVLTWFILCLPLVTYVSMGGGHHVRDKTDVNVDVTASRAPHYSQLHTQSVLTYGNPENGITESHYPYRCVSSYCNQRTFLFLRPDGRHSHRSCPGSRRVTCDCVS